MRAQKSTQTITTSMRSANDSDHGLELPTYILLVNIVVNCYTLVLDLIVVVVIIIIVIVYS